MQCLQYPSCASTSACALAEYSRVFLNIHRLATWICLGQIYKRKQRCISGHELSLFIEHKSNIQFQSNNLGKGLQTYSDVGCFLFYLFFFFLAYRPFETVFQSISGRLPKRGRKRRERIDESKNVQTTPPAPTARAVGPCPTVIQTSRTPRHWKFTQDHRTTRPPPTYSEIL